MKLIDHLVFKVLAKDHQLPKSLHIGGGGYTDENYFVYCKGAHYYVSDEYRLETYCTYYDTYEQAFYAAWRWHMEGRRYW